MNRTEVTSALTKPSVSGGEGQGAHVLEGGSEEVAGSGSLTFRGLALVGESCSEWDFKKARDEYRTDGKLTTGRKQMCLSSPPTPNGMMA